MMRNGLLGALLLLALALALGLAAYASAGRYRIAPQETVVHSEITIVAPPRPEPIPDTAFAANVFHKLRGAKQQITPHTTAKASAPLAQGNFTLHGIFSYGDRRGALISGNASGVIRGKAPQRIFRVGDPAGENYHVTEISAREVILSRGSEKLTLQLYKKTEKKP